MNDQRFNSPTWRWLLAAAVALALPCAPAPAAAARMKLATLAPKDSSFHTALKEMAQAWRDAPGGGVALTIYPDGSMGSEADMVRRMRAGQIQAAMLTVVGLTQIDESASALQNMPLAFGTLDEVDYIQDKLRDKIDHRFRDKGFIVLFWSDAGWVHFFSRSEVQTPDDVKKLKLFVWAGDNQSVDLWKAYGFQPVPLETGDILSGLNTGLIDVVCSVPSYALAGQFYQQTPHMLTLKWAPLVGGLVVTQKAWDALPAATRDALQTSAADAGRKIKANSRTEGLKSIDAMKSRGLKVHDPTPQAEAEWRKLVEAANPKIRGTIVPADLFDEVQRLLKEYRDKQPAQPGP